MKSNLIFIFVIGLAGAAISEVKLPKKDWDDEDSMILPSTTSKGFSSFSRVPAEEKPEIDVTLDDRTRYVSLIPASEQQQSSPEEVDVAKDDAHSESQVQQKSEEDSDSSASSEYTTEGSRIRLVQLGKIPLTYEIIPLMSPDEYSGGKSNMKTVSFFPEQSGEMMAIKAKELRREQQELQQQRHDSNNDESAEAETETGNISPGDLPPEPLTYLTPPKQDAENYWRQYPLSSQQDFDINMGENHEASVTEADFQEPTKSTLNPILERLNAFLQKAKRHSDEQQYQDSTSIPEEEENVEGNEESTGETKEVLAPGASQTQDNDDEDSTGTSSNIENDARSEFSKADELPTSSTPTSTLNSELVPPKPDAVPETEPYPRSAFQPSPYWPNAAASPSMDQYFSDYIPTNTVPINKYYYSNPNPSHQLSTFMKPPAPTRQLYQSLDSYMPQQRRYLPIEKALSNEIDYPFIRYNDYRPQRSNLIVRPTPALINSINDEAGLLPPISYTNDDGLGYNDYGNSRIGLGSNRYDSYYPRSYLMNNYRPIVPYRPYYTSSSALVNNLMYAPLYSYDQYRQLQQPQQEFI